MHAGRWSSLEVNERARYRGEGQEEVVVTCRIMSSDVLFRSECHHKNSLSCQFGDILGVGIVTENHSAPLLTRLCVPDSWEEVWLCGDWMDAAVQLVCVCRRAAFLLVHRRCFFLPQPPGRSYAVVVAYFFFSRKKQQKKQNNFFLNPQFGSFLNAACVRWCIPFSTLRPCSDQCLCVPVWE